MNIIKVREMLETKRKSIDVALEALANDPVVEKRINELRADKDFARICELVRQAMEN